jgi:hypothetical protein
MLLAQADAAPWTVHGLTTTADAVVASLAAHATLESSAHVAAVVERLQQVLERHLPVAPILSAAARADAEGLTSTLGTLHGWMASATLLGVPWGPDGVRGIARTWANPATPLAHALRIKCGALAVAHLGQLRVAVAEALATRRGDETLATQSVKQHSALTDITRRVTNGAVELADLELAIEEGRAGVAWSLARRRLFLLDERLRPQPRLNAAGVPEWPREHTPAPGAEVYDYVRIDHAVHRYTAHVAALRDLQATLRTRRFESARASLMATGSGGSTASGAAGGASARG